MKRGKKVHIYTDYIDVAESIKKESSDGQKKSIEFSINRWVRIGIREDGLLPKNGEEEK